MRRILGGLIGTVALFGGAIQAETIMIQWPSAVNDSNLVKQEKLAQEALGPPDGVVAAFKGPPHPQHATYSGFGGGGSHDFELPDLASLLMIEPEQLAKYDVISFDHNGDSGLGFEDSTWTFADGEHTLEVTLDSGHL